MEKAFIEKAYAAVNKKVDKLDNNFVNYIIRAMVAGFFLTLIYPFVLQIVNDFSGTAVAPFGKVLMAYLFGLGLTFIIYFGAELFTSNTMYFAIGTTHKKTSFLKATKLLVICWIFNLVGSFIMAFILTKTGVLGQVDGVFMNETLYEFTAKKANLDSSQIFYRGILANWVVNIVVFIAVVAKDDIAKLFILPLGLMPFVYLGFEHSIANMAIFSIAWLNPDATAAISYHGEFFTTAGALNNLLFATLGNLVGGAVLVGGYFAFLNRKMIDKKDDTVE